MRLESGRRGAPIRIAHFAGDETRNGGSDDEGGARNGIFYFGTHPEARGVGPRCGLSVSESGTYGAGRRGGRRNANLRYA